MAKAFDARDDAANKPLVAKATSANIPVLRRFSVEKARTQLPPSGYSCSLSPVSD
jgi:hypothetical protein